jgi:hypothetical protein
MTNGTYERAARTAVPAPHSCAEWCSKGSAHREGWDYSDDFEAIRTCTSRAHTVRGAESASFRVHADRFEYYERRSGESARTPARVALGSEWLTVGQARKLAALLLEAAELAAHNAA